MRIFRKYWFLIVLFGVSIFGMFASKVSFLQVDVTLGKEIVDCINEITFTLSGSYIVGFIVFVLTVAIPEWQRSKHVIAIISMQIRYAMDESTDLMNVICGKSNISDLNQIVNGLVKQDEDKYIVSEKNALFILNSINKINTNLLYTMLKIEYQKGTDINRVKGVAEKILKTSYLIKEYGGREIFFTKNSIHEFANNLRQIHSLLVELNTSVDNFINNKSE